MAAGAQGAVEEDVHVRGHSGNTQNYVAATYIESRYFNDVYNYIASYYMCKLEPPYAMNITRWLLLSNLMFHPVAIYC